MNAREHALNLMKRIIAKEAELRTLENELDQLLPKNNNISANETRNGIVPVTPAAERTLAVPPLEMGSDGTANLTDQILAFLREHPTEGFNAERMSQSLALPSDRIHTVRSTLWNLAKKGKIRKIKRGEFASLKTADRMPVEGA
jgi:hypothetical protein